ncbi:hypothetical protein M419DRAFT_89299 [Trichoderma reesei RUT C-30]|uniref:Uncharacterized protein n=1 Tax=Hypocrea jecorina (strain ATCC 56765 / BCRC 32924 / NRRL 11460 / Rut C-30) TaxID=1344414 RepID=A0A024RZ59_HYPJR|nr:hypothetical protein M419DRAFT_89299 [Trichoderma reesei RUT C-30]
MNWMGGNLSRHRRGKGWKEEMARQKEYFAKARSRLREQDKAQPPVTLSAADFVPNYVSPAKRPTASLRRAGASPSSVLGGKPVPAAPEVLTSLEDRPKIQSRDVTKLPIAFPLGGNERPPLSDQAARYRSVGTSDPRAGFQGLLKRIDSSGTEMPRRPVLQLGRERGFSTNFRHTSEQQKQLGVDLDHRKPSEGGRQRDNRKRKLRQATPSPRSVRIRVGSQDYRWSKSRNLTESPAHAERLQTQSTAPERPRNRMQSIDVNHSSHLVDEGLTGSSSSSSHPTMSSPCRSRASRLRQFHNSTSHVRGRIPTELVNPPRDRGCESASNSPSSAPSPSEIDSMDSTAVQASDDGHMPESEVDEERIWRQWLEW